MAPTLAPGDRLYVDVRAYRHRSPRRGELVVARDSEAPGRFFVKRVAFGAGDRPSPDAPPVPAGSVYLLGDNSAISRDSRQFGPVSLGSIVGRVYRCYLPGDRRREF